ncbi:hypothetical protein F5883DRAFT_561681 [Diaporthe sp. PMI_573]|nr:hypothetical protein F5883DRAFT_561681 [Diaporthaceae sp. PMI_573]
MRRRAYQPTLFARAAWPSPSVLAAAPTRTALDHGCTLRLGPRRAGAGAAAPTAGAPARPGFVPCIDARLSSSLVLSRCRPASPSSTPMTSPRPAHTKQ